MEEYGCAFPSCRKRKSERESGIVQLVLGKKYQAKPYLVGVARRHAWSTDLASVDLLEFGRTVDIRFTRTGSIMPRFGGNVK